MYSEPNRARSVRKLKYIQNNWLKLWMKLKIFSSNNSWLSMYISFDQSTIWSWPEEKNIPYQNKTVDAASKSCVLDNNSFESHESLFDIHVYGDYQQNSSSLFLMRKVIVSWEWTSTPKKTNWHNNGSTTLCYFHILYSLFVNLQLSL